MKLPIFISIFLLTSFTYAQKVEIGPLLSFGHSFCDQQISFKQISRKTFSPGFTVNYWMNSRFFSIGSGVIYDQRGYKTATDTYRINYITVPLRVSLTLGKTIFIRPSIGTNLSFLSNSKRSDNTTKITESFATESTDLSYFASFATGFYIKKRISFYANLKLINSFVPFVFSDDWGKLKHRKQIITLGLNFSV
mgnify:CR=1 FL=1